MTRVLRGRVVPWSCVCRVCLFTRCFCMYIVQHQQKTLKTACTWAGSFGLDKKVSVLDLSNYWTLSPVPKQSSTSKPWLIKEPKAQGGEENLELPRLAEHFWCVTCCFNRKFWIPCVTCHLASSVERIKDKCEFLGWLLFYPFGLLQRIFTGMCKIVTLPIMTPF